MDNVSTQTRLFIAVVSITMVTMGMVGMVRGLVEGLPLEELEGAEVEAETEVKVEVEAEAEAEAKEVGG